MRKKGKMLLIVGIIIILLVALLLLIINNNKEKVITCSATNKKMVLTFEKGNIVYLKGYENLGKLNEEDKQNIEYNLSHYNNVITFDEENNNINFSMNYNKENQYALEYIGFSYNDSPKYKDVIKRLESDNYYCK